MTIWTQKTSYNNQSTCSFDACGGHRFLHRTVTSNATGQESFASFFLSFHWRISPTEKTSIPSDHVRFPTFRLGTQRSGILLMCHSSVRSTRKTLSTWGKNDRKTSLCVTLWSSSLFSAMPSVWICWIKCWTIWIWPMNDLTLVYWLKTWPMIYSTVG